MDTTKEKFTKVTDSILASRKLTASQKLLVSYVWRWQSSGKVCFESNSTLARHFGLTLAALKKQITVLNKMPFFESKETSGLNIHGKWSNSKEMKVNVDALRNYINAKEEKKTNRPVVERRPDVELNFDNIDVFTDFVNRLTHNQAPEDQIKYCFDYMPIAEVERNRESITHTFKQYIPPPPAQPSC